MRILFFLIFFFTNIFLCSSQTVDDVYGDSKWYIQLKGGYGISFPNSPLDSPLNEIKPAFISVGEDSIIRQTSSYGTMGPGLKVEIQIGRVLSNNLAVEIGTRYNKANEVNLATVRTPTFSAIHDVQTTWFDVMPGFVVSTGFNKKFSMYSRISLSLPVAGNTKSLVSIDDREGRLATYYLNVYRLLLPTLNENLTSLVSTKIEVDADTEGAFSVGFSGALGAKMQISDKLSLIAEISLQSLHIKAKESIYNSFTQSSELNGFPIVIDSSQEYFNHTIYLDEITSESNFHLYNEQVDVDAPKEEIAFKQNHSNASLLVGLSFSF